jgi:gluconolactonase
MKMKIMFVFAILFCVFEASLILSQAPARQEAAPGPEKPTVATAIPGIVAAGTRIERVWTTPQAADGLIAEPNGTLLIPEQGELNRVSKLEGNGRTTVYLTDTNEAGGIAIDTQGRVISIERSPPSRIRVLAPEPRRVLAQAFEGTPFQRLSDIVADTKGGVYVTESPSSSVFYLSATGQLKRLVNDSQSANGITLSPDERTLYVTNNPNGILAYDIQQPEVTLRNRRLFAKPEGGQDGLAVDAAARLYVASDLGVQIFSPQGQHLGLIPTPRGLTTLAFGGPDKKTLYVLGRGNDLPGGQMGRSLYRISMLAEGFKGRAK